MKKWLVTLCVAAMLMGLVACGNKDDGSNASTESDTVENSVDNSTAQESENQSAADGESATDGGDSENGNASGENNGGWSEEMSALRAAVVEELGDDYWPNMEMPAEYMESTFGLTSDMYEDFLGEMPMISTNIDTLLIVKAAEGQADAVEEALINHQKNLQENTMQYPQNLDKIQASKVERIDNYVIFALLGGDVTGVEEQGSDAVIVYVQEQNQRALDVIRQNLPQ